MKIRIWDVLTVLTVIAIFACIGVYLMIFINPQAPLNPLRPPTLVPTIVIPTDTPTPKGLPPTWTPTVPPEATATLKPSSTPEPTSTFFLVPSFTPSNTPPPTTTPTLEQSLTPSPKDMCSLVSQSPADGAQFPPNADFDASWTVRNMTGSDWPADSIDVRFTSGSNLARDGSAFDMNNGISSGGTGKVVVDMVSPSSTGTYISNWALVQGTKTVCVFYIAIVVK